MSVWNLRLVLTSTVELHAGTHLRPLNMGPSSPIGSEAKHGMSLLTVKTAAL